MKSFAPVPCRLQRIWMRPCAFFADHRLVLPAMLLGMVAAQPLAGRLFRLVFRYL
jgi:hypothetical protein